MVEISRSRIIRITNYSARTYTYIYVRASPAAICIESDDDVVEPEVEKEKTQSSIEAPLPAGQVPTVRGATRTVSVRKDVQTARR